METYLGNWSCKEDVARDFEVTLDENVRILVASYDTPSYEGYAFVLFKVGRKFYEVNGSHCSCYGLEGQWEPEETSLAEIRHRVKEGNLGYFMAGFDGEVLKEMAKL
jgi:hypothetical protein